VPDFFAALAALVVILLFSISGWLLSLMRRDVSIVDSLWSLFFLIGLLVYAAYVTPGPRLGLMFALVSLWAIRLSAYLTWRNWGEPEDRRYQAIRDRNQPGFSWKSLYLVFGLQGILAWLIAMPLFAAASGTNPLGLLDLTGVVLWIIGFVFETVGDWQLSRFRADPANRGKVLATGLWRYTRHPNYFGEATLWWGYFLIAAGSGGWWTVLAPILMTFLLLRVSGVTLLEQDIGDRRPAYRDYIARTNAFIPWRPREAA